MDEDRKPFDAESRTKEILAWLYEKFDEEGLDRFTKLFGKLGMIDALGLLAEVKGYDLQMRACNGCSDDMHIYVTTAHCMGVEDALRFVDEAPWYAD